jgi:3-deoxy-D-manno-octulosonate 8-phosphate phosphatase (KDO 8-P phosphatase)
MDVDGVLTDGTVLLDGDGHQLKRIAFKDVMGVSLGRRAGLLFALVSGEGGPLLDAIAAKLGVTDVYADCTDKAAALQDFADRYKIALEEICYVGDDVNDLPALEMCGLGAAPSDAHPAVLSKATLVTSSPAGAGSVREVVERLLVSSHGPQADDRS